MVSGRRSSRWQPPRGSVAEFPGGIHLAEFSALDPVSAAQGGGHPEVTEVVGAVLGVRDDTARSGDGPLSPVTRVAHALGDGPVLLILDNCEHVVAPVAELAEQLLKQTPALHILGTSRVPLGVTGEWLEEVSPLRRPTSVAGLGTADVREFSAVELFVRVPPLPHRVFVLDDGTLDAVVSICRRWTAFPWPWRWPHGACARWACTNWPPGWTTVSHVLAVGSRGAPARQRTLRAVIDWIGNCSETRNRRYCAACPYTPTAARSPRPKSCARGTACPRGRSRPRVPARGLLAAGRDRRRGRLGGPPATA